MRRSQFGMWALICVAFFATACTQVQFVSQYDQVTDEGVTALQKKVSQHISTLQGQVAPECRYSHHKDFYLDAMSDVSVLITRAEILNVDDRNSQTLSQLRDVGENLEDLRKLHEEIEPPPPTDDEDNEADEDSNAGCLSTDAVELTGNIMDTMFRAILRLEIAKKRELDSANVPE